MLITLILPALAFETLSPDAVPVPPMYGGVRQTSSAWRDAIGENLLTWSATPGGISIHHLRVAGGRVYRVRSLEQSAPPCDDDQTFRIDSAPTLSDADRDGIAEISFAVISACITDMSAKAVTVSLWEDGAAYHLEGHTIWWDTLDSGTLSPTLLDHAVSRQPALQATLEARYAALIEAERRAVSAEATITAAPPR